MSKRRFLDAFIVVFVVAASFIFVPLPLVAASCEELAAVKLPAASIVTVQSIAAGEFAPSVGGTRGAAGQFRDLPAFCRVAAVLRPSDDSEIKIEVWLPAANGWNGKFQAVGNGGWSGAIIPGPLAAALRRGYATAMTDTGHEGGSGSFALGHPEKLIDFGFRAVHEMTVTAKAIIAEYYGSGPKLSYWNGCSSGGKQGLKEAQRFPADYDGIIAGAPANFWTHLMTASIWIAQAVHRSESSYIPPDKYPVIHNAAVQACDAHDGVKDGVLENPAQCTFDPQVIQCKSGDAPGCLTSAQVDAARNIYASATNPRTKQTIYPGLAPGSELAWGGLAGPQPLSIATDHWKYVVFKDPNWDFKKLNFDSDIELIDKIDNGLINATDPNLKPFFDRGGKLLQYHGWNDQLISPYNSINYYNSVRDRVGASTVEDAYRLFMVPGMNHCSGGAGTSTFDAIGALEQWVEKGKVPDQIQASHSTNGIVDRTRPLCPYPRTAAYKGTGSTDEAANFVCK